jgi:hypothetical protein
MSKQADKYIKENCSGMEPVYESSCILTRCHEVQ